jgi:lipopolysaccharide/colanic/teichoic acid biosynthesis glycosyltransferase
MGSAAQQSQSSDRERSSRTPSAEGQARVLSVPASTYQNAKTAAFHFDARESERRNHELATRIIQVVVAALALIIVSPLCIVIAAAIKLTSRGPVFHRQRRIGVDRRWRRGESFDERRRTDLGGRPFTMYKFRTMNIDAEEPNQEVWATPDDRRVTPVGRLLRATRLDELPQMFNVLCGDMNIVGPRPERPGIFAELRASIPDYHVRQRVLPGITGWAQINQAYDTCVEDVQRKVAYDLEYLECRSVGLDLHIMARTISVMALSKGW